MSHPQAEALAQAFVSNFWSADQSIHWEQVEVEMSTMLDPHTMLVGRVDAIGTNEVGKKFFGEWKTASAWNAKRMDSVKAQWRMRPQSLTYGVLCDATIPGIRDFTVRWAIKTNPPTCAFEWYTYTDAELTWWREQVKGIAEEIRMKRKWFPTENWPANLDNCFKYGEKYVCPFFYPCCSQLKFGEKPENSIVRISHLDTERTLVVTDPELVVLDATRITTWLGCQERYRREYEENTVADGSEALEVGSDFHDLYGEHIKRLIK